MHSSDMKLIRLLREPQTGAVTLGGRVGSVASTSPVTALVDGVQIPCRQIAGQSLSVGQPCVLVTFGAGVKPLLIQTV